MPTPSDISKAIQASIMKKVEILVDAKLQEFLSQMLPPSTQTVDVPQHTLEVDSESERTKWSDEDWRQIAICYEEKIDAKIAHRLFPHLKEGSIRCKYGEYRYIDTNGESGLCGSESSRTKARTTLESIRR